MMAAGKLATTDGSVMVARSCDAPGGDASLKTLAVSRKMHEPGEVIRFHESQMVTIPQIPQTYAYIAVLSDIEGRDIAEAEGGINEFWIAVPAPQQKAGEKSGLEPQPSLCVAIGDFLPVGMAHGRSFEGHRCGRSLRHPSDAASAR